MDKLSDAEYDAAKYRRKLNNAEKKGKGEEDVERYEMKLQEKSDMADALRKRIDAATRRERAEREKAAAAQALPWSLILCFTRLCAVVLCHHCCSILYAP